MHCVFPRACACISCPTCTSAVVVVRRRTTTVFVCARVRKPSARIAIILALLVVVFFCPLFCLIIYFKLYRFRARTKRTNGRTDGRTNVSANKLIVVVGDVIVCARRPHAHNSNSACTHIRTKHDGILRRSVRSGLGSCPEFPSARFWGFPIRQINCGTSNKVD